MSTSWKNSQCLKTQKMSHLLQFCFLTASKLARSGPTSDIVVGNLTFETFKLICNALWLFILCLWLLLWLFHRIWKMFLARKFQIFYFEKMEFSRNFFVIFKMFWNCDDKKKKKIHRIWKIFLAQNFKCFLLKSWNFLEHFCHFQTLFFFVIFQFNFIIHFIFH